MARHTELTNIPIDQGNYRFCLDRVVRDDLDDRRQYAFVWRGTRASPDGFVPKPAYFDWGLLGQTIRQALTEGQLDHNEISSFLQALLGIEEARES